MGDFCVTDVVTRTPIWEDTLIYLIGIREELDGKPIFWNNSTYDFLGLLDRAVRVFDEENSDQYDWIFVERALVVLEGAYDRYGCVKVGKQVVGDCRRVFGYPIDGINRYFYVRKDIFDRIAPEGKTFIHRLLEFVRFCFRAHIPLFFDQVLGLQYPWDHDLNDFELRERLTSDILRDLEDQFIDYFEED